MYHAYRSPCVREVQLFHKIPLNGKPFKDKRYALNNFNRFNEFSRNLNRLQGEVPFSELLAPKFMVRFTNFTSFDDLLAKSGFKLDTVEDFVNISDRERDAFIASNTRFANWDAMLQKAFEEYAQQKSGI